MKRESTKLGARIEVPVDEARLARGWSAIERRWSRSAGTGLKGRPGRTAALGALTALATALLIWMPVVPSGDRPLEVTSGVRPEVALARAADGGFIPWSDGSIIELEPRTELELLENSAAQFSLLLRRGEARFRVQPGARRRWVVEAGELSVEVIGTVFTVRRSPAGVEVLVERGQVLVRSDRLPDRVQRLNGPEHPGGVGDLFIPVDSEAGPQGLKPAPPREPPPVEPRPTRSRRTVEPGSPSAGPPSSEPAPSARAPARSKASRPEPAAELPTTTPPAWPVDAPETELRTVARLLGEVDEARGAGDEARALRLLGEASALSGDPDVGLARFTLGRLLVRAGRDGEAAEAFRDALESGLPAAMAERARARLLGLLSGPEQLRIAQDYLRHHPDGPEVETALRVDEGGGR